MSYAIGVLAGMGPRSTAPFIDMIISSCQKLYGAKYDIDFPLIHILSLPTPFYPGCEIDEEKMKAALYSGVDKLVKANVNIIIVPCNLAHCWFDVMLKACGQTPLVHIADSSIVQIPKKTQRVTIFATEQTIKNGFYQSRLKDSGYETFVDGDIQSSVTSLIKKIKNLGYDSSTVISHWKILVSLVDNLGVDCVLIACTDISPLAKIIPSTQVSFVDAAECLADFAVREYMENGLNKIT